MSGCFQPVALDGSPKLLQMSYWLRYQVYCVERGFLPAADYPNQMECDEFDWHSVHVGVMTTEDQLVGTARIVLGPNLPLFRYCKLFPHVTVLDDSHNKLVEVSRVSISRQYSRRRDDAVSGGPVVSETEVRAPIRTVGNRRQRRAEPFVTLLKAIVYAAKHEGATHLIGATDPALHRWLVHYGFPYRVAGPGVDYYGHVAPYIMSLAELDQVVLSGEFAVLEGFPVGSDLGLWPQDVTPRISAESHRTSADQLVRG